MSDPKEPQSAAGGDWLDEEIVIPTLEAETPPAEEVKEPPVEEKAAEIQDSPKEAAGKTEAAVDEKSAAAEDISEEDKGEDGAADEEETPAEVVAAPKKEAPKQIPKKRFDQVNNRLKEAEKQLREINTAKAQQRAAVQKGTVPQDDAWFDEREDAYMNAVINGEVDEAKGIRHEIRGAEEQRTARFVENRTAKMAADVPDAQAVSTMISTLEEHFPVLDKSADEFDSDTVAEVLTLQRGYMQSDKLISPAQALEKAAARLGMDMDAPAVEEAPAPVKPGKLSDATAAIETSNAQPPEIGTRAGFDNGEESIDWGAFSEGDMEKLPVSKQRELRGDTFAG
jgi:hypothetical protein